MGAHAIARPTAQPEAFDGLTRAEKTFIAGIGSLLANDLTAAVDAAAKRFLESAPTHKATRRRSHALLRLAGGRDQ